MEYLVNIYKKYCDFLENYSDKRTTKWLIMDSPFPTLIITMLYVLIVKVMIPKYMKNRKEFCIKNCLQVYNIWHFSVNVSFFYLSSSLTYLAGYNWRCEPLDTSITGKPLMIANGAWWYFILRFTDLTETIIFGFGKRYNIMTRYHVIHHFLTPNMLWGGVKFFPGGHATFVCFINTFAHIITYGYHILVGSFPQMKKKLWWFRTFHKWMLAIETIILFGHSLQLLIWNDCNFPIWFIYYVLFYGTLYTIPLTFCHYRSKNNFAESSDIKIVRVKISDS